MTDSGEGGPPNRRDSPAERLREFELARYADRTSIPVPEDVEAADADERDEEPDEANPPGQGGAFPDEASVAAGESGALGPGRTDPPSEEIEPTSTTNGDDGRPDDQDSG